MNRTRRTRVISAAILWLSLMFVGLSIYKDYGISWDEPRNRRNGMTSLKYVGERFAPNWVARDRDLRWYSTPLPEYRDRDYGVAFEVPLAFLERLTGLQDSREIYFFRHLATFVTCSFGVLAVLHLANRRFQGWCPGVLTALFLILTPRLFADFFYNSKDAVFMAAFAIGTNTAVHFVLRPSSWSAVRHALATALAIDVRVVGVILAAATVAVMVVRIVRSEVAPRTSLVLVVYVALTILGVVAFWPYLWPAPWSNFVDAAVNMSRFRWKESVLYLGIVTPGPELSWHYPLVWIAISMPISHLALFLLGAAVVIRNQVGQRRLLWRSESELQDLFFLALTVGPVVGVIALDAVLYDGWRQLYFIAPTFILVSLRGWVALREWGPRNRRHAWLGLVSLATLLTLGHISLWMYRAHPYQNVYMNTFAGANPKTRFDLDYWGLTNREALEYIVARDERRSITVWPGSFTPLGHSLLMLDPADRARVRLAETETAADYVVTNYRLDRRDYSSEDPTLHMFHQIRVCGEVVNSTYMRLAPRFPMEGEARN